MKGNFSHFAAVFPVKNPFKSAKYYEEVLGFETTFKWEDPATYVIVKRDNNVSIHFTEDPSSSFLPPKEHAMLCVFVHDVDAVYQELIKAGASIINEIGNREYGMRDFDIKDPDGFIICFTQGL